MSEHPQQQRQTLAISNKNIGCVRAKTWCYQSHAHICTWN